METLETIQKRHSTRKYTKDIPSKDILDKIIASGLLAPVACGRRDQISIKTIYEPTLMHMIDQAAATYSKAPGAHPLYGAPLLVIVSALISPDIPTANPYLNVGCVVENMALAASDLGIGNVILALPVRAILQHKNILMALNLPESFMPICAIALGYAC